MATRYRAQLINSISGFKSASLVGTRSDEGYCNLAIFSSVIHLGSNPALIGFISRPETVERHTLRNIKQTKQFTINQVSEAFWESAHQTSARYSEAKSEFLETGLTPQHVDNINVPFVLESQLKYALTLKEIIPISYNDTLLVIGEVTDILCNESALKADGYIDLEALSTVAITGLDSYHSTLRLSRLKYAKPGFQPVRIGLDGEVVEGNNRMEVT